jgi:phosphatidylinositol alpha-1,6-mannosyltransferase
VVWVHGEEVAIYQHYRGKRALMPEIFGASRAVVCNSSFSRSEAVRAGAAVDRVQVVHPCVEWQRFQGPFEVDDLRVRLAFDGRAVLLSVGRLTKRKGHDHVLRALAKLDRRDVVYVIASDGEYEPELRSLVGELRLDDVVRFVGPVPASELPRYYAMSDVFVMANRTLEDGDVEGFGLVFLEASASGLPVIGGRSGGVVDAVLQDETGLLVDGASVDDVAEAIERLLDDSALRSRLGERGRAWTATEFDWDRASRRVRSIAEGAKAPPLDRRPSAPAPSPAVHHAR